jgi:solute carrier family 25 oxoglutarate transporter 11
MVDLWPKKNGVDIWQGNYRKAASWLWFAAPSWNIAFPGLFKNYFWHVAPM